MQRFLFAMIFGLGGFAILISLGVWQVQRLAWKENLLAQIEARIGEDPQPLAAALASNADRYSPVQTEGSFSEGHVRMLASRKTIGPVFRIVRPFEAEGVGRILVDTGWLPDGDPLPAVPRDRMALVGNLDTPNEADSFTPEPDLARNIWFARDVPALADALDTEPVFVVLRTAPKDPLGVTPWPVNTAGIPNDHLQYAITWFSLAALWVGMTAFFMWRTRRVQPES